MATQFTFKEGDTPKQIIDALTRLCASNPALMDKPVVIDGPVIGGQITFEIRTLEETELFKKICDEWEDFYGKSRNQIPIGVYALRFHHIRGEQLERFWEYVKANTHYMHS